MTDESNLGDYLVISRGRWDADKSPAEIQRAIDAFYAWHDRLVREGRMRSGSRLSTERRVVSKAGITDGPLLAGVRYHAQRAETDSLVLRGETGTRRMIHAEHLLKEP